MQVQREKVTIDTPAGPMPAQLARPAPTVRSRP